MYIYIFVVITFCVITIVIISIFTIIIFFLVLSVVLAQVIFHVSRIFKLYVNFSKFCINSTELANEFTTEDDRWTIETCLVLNLKLLSIC